MVRALNEAGSTEWKGFYSRETIGSPFLAVAYRTTPTAPISLRPASGTMVDTLAPVLSGQPTGGDGESQAGRFKITDVVTGTQVESERSGTVTSTPGSSTPPATACMC